MQQIERYGVIALVFLLVTIVAVSFWGDKKSPGFWARLTGKSAQHKEAALGGHELARNELTATERAVEDAMPLSAGAPTHSGAQASAPLNDPANLFAPESSDVATLGAAQSAEARTLALPTQGSAAALSSNTGALSPAPVEPMLSTPLANDRSIAAVQSDPVASVKRASTSDTSSMYTVQKGDSLGSIARKMLGQSSRWPEIQALNAGVEPKSLRVGMKLKLPAGAKGVAESTKLSSDVARKTTDTAKKPVTEKRDAPAAAASSKTYVVRSGDNLHQIAQDRLGDGRRWQEIVKLNPGLDPKRLIVGQKLKLPALPAGETGRALVAQASASSSPSTSGKPRVR